MEYAAYIEEMEQVHADLERRNRYLMGELERRDAEAQGKLVSPCPMLKSGGSSMTPPDWMIINATRYALAHMTHEVSETAEWLIESWDELNGVVKNQLRHDIEAELGRDDAAIQEESFRRSVAMEIDRREWEKVRELWQPLPGREGEG